MPTKRSVQNSLNHDVNEDIATLPTKFLASDEVQEMDIDGPAVITEVIPGGELSNSDDARYTSEDLDNINRLNVSLDEINEKTLEDGLRTEIMDTSEQSTPSPAQILSDISPTEVINETSPSTTVTIPESPNSKKAVTSVSNHNSTASTVVVKVPSKASSNSTNAPTIFAASSSTVTQSTSGQQIRLVPVSQGNAGGIPVQIIQGQGSNAPQLVLTSLPGSPNKAVLKSIGTVNSSLLTSPMKQNVSATTLPSGSVSPIKQGIVLGKMLSPTKSPTKIAMIPVSLSKASQVQKFLPTLSVCNSNISLMTSTVASTGSAQSGISVINSVSPTVMSAPDLQRLINNNSQQAGQRIVSAVSPTKMIQVRGQVASGPVIARLSGPGIKQVSAVSSNALQGNKLQFIRLVSSSSGGKTNATLVPVTALQTTTTKILTTVAVTSAITTPVSTVVRPIVRPSSSNQIRMTIPIAPAIQAQTMRQTAPRVAQKVLIPAPNISGVTQIRQSVSASSLNHLPPGTTLISGGNNNSSIVMVPAQYISQLQSGQQSTTAKSAIAPKPIIPTSPPIVMNDASNTLNSGAAIKPNFIPKSSDTNGVRPRKPCNCTKSQCLKLYCDCFANGEFCSNCNCNHCFNNLDHEEDRQKAIKACLDRNPQAFHPKIGKGRDGDVERRHNKGCNCKRSGCFKNYCECYEAKILCTDMCKCVGCKNYEETADRKSLMHLADAAEVRVQQQNDATNKFSIQIKDLPCRPSTISSTGEKLPFSFVTKDVAEVTCQCLIAQAGEAENENYSKVATEQLILEEFGRCLKKIIDYAHRTKLNV